MSEGTIKEDKCQVERRGGSRVKIEPILKTL